MLANKSLFQGTGREEYRALTVLCSKCPNKDGSSIDSQEEETYHDRQ